MALLLAVYDIYVDAVSTVASGACDWAVMAAWAKTLGREGTGRHRDQKSAKFLTNFFHFQSY